MKLLQPKELNTKLQEQKRVEIDAGLFLAKKVDRLREEVADAEKEHVETVKRLEEEHSIFLNEKRIEKERVEKEISELTEERRLLRIPLHKEWSKVKEESDKNTETSVKLIEKETKLAKDIESIEKRLKDISQKEIEIRELKNQLRETLNSAKFLQKKSKLDSDKTYEIRQLTEKTAFEKYSEIQKIENLVLFREVDAENKWNNALEKEASNERETKHIESKQRQLRAAFAELDKKNG